MRRLIGAVLLTIAAFAHANRECVCTAFYSGANSEPFVQISDGTNGDGAGAAGARAAGARGDAPAAAAPTAAPGPCPRG